MNITLQEIEKLKKIIVDAGEILLKYYNKNNETKIKDDGTQVSQADIEVNNYIETQLSDLFPEYGIVSEEGRRDWKELTFTVDPLDGTQHFTKGEPFFSIMIGLLVNNYPNFGMIYNPITKRLFYGGENIPAIEVISINENRLLKVNKDQKDNILVVSREDVIKRTLERLDTIIFKKIVRTENEKDDIKHKFLFIADNQANIYIDDMDHSFGIWDICPPQAILEAAGGVVRDGNGNNLTYLKNEFNISGIFAADSVDRITSVFNKHV